jgi:hypothetical protein
MAQWQTLVDNRTHGRAVLRKHSVDRPALLQLKLRKVSSPAISAVTRHVGRWTRAFPLQQKRQRTPRRHRAELQTSRGEERRFVRAVKSPPSSGACASSRSGHQSVQRQRNLMARLVEPTLGHYPRLALVLLVGEALNVLKQHLRVAGQDRPIDMPARIPQR